MGKKNPAEESIRLLDTAVQVARDKGYPITGWTLQADLSEGFAAWLYVEGEDSQESVFEEVNVYGVMEDAALFCYESALALPAITDTDRPFLYGGSMLGSEEGEG